MTKLKGISSIVIAVSLIFIGSNTGYAQPNVILIVIDALRADHLSCYGYKRNTSPNIDKLAKQAIVFEQAIAQAGWTLPSHASLFTSKYVSSHKVDWKDKKLSEEELTLAEILKSYGYKTVAFTRGIYLKSIYNLDQGFDIYYDVQEKVSVSFPEIIPPVFDWLEENKDNKFFLFLHGNDVHAPYYCPQPYENMYDPDYKGIVDTLHLDYDILKSILILDDGKKRIKLTKRDVNHIIAHYDGGITYADTYIGKLLKKLDELNLTDKTIIILTSDHGEEFLEHGRFGHSPKMGRPYEELIRVPLIIRYPAVKAKNRRIGTQVQLIDIMPTLLDFLSIPKSPGIQGESLVPLIEGNVDEGFNRYVYTEASSGIMAIRTANWKLIYSNNGSELFDLKSDPDEQNNLINQKPEVAVRLLKELFLQQETMLND